MRNDLGELSAFAIVAEERSFTRAAARLGVSQSALSHSMRGLEKKLGLQLLARTTRSVSPTAAGTALLRDLAPALERIERAVAETRKQRESPAGRIRLIIPRTATQMVILPKLAHFARTYPEIVLEITSSNDPVDLVAGEYDAGVQLGEFIQRDMIAVRVTQEMRLAVVGSPQYFKSHDVPRKPQDLKGPASFDDPDLVIKAVLNAVGIGTAMEEQLKGMISAGRLIQVLRDWCPTFQGYFLYYPSRRNQPAALSALIDTLRLSD